jgi:hypothetical protein
MTTLTIRKASKEELQAHIDGELACYAIRTTGFDTDMSAEPDFRGNFPRKLFLGAIEQITERSLLMAIGKLQDFLDKGYKLYVSHTAVPQVVPSTGAAILYLTKPEALQAEDKTKIIAEVTAKYTADIDAHNEKVFVQEAEALKAEEAAIAAQLRAEDEQRVQAEFDKRVRERMRGSKAGAK